MKKKLLALTMAAAMTAALLAGCGGTPAPVNPTLCHQQRFQLSW